MLLIFLKHPAPGAVKTRIAKTIGDERAADLYRSWIGRILGVLQSLRPSTSLVGVHAGAAATAFAEWDHLVDDWWPQPDGDLGRRLADGFVRAHRLAHRVIAIGADCLEIEPALVDDAFERLNSVQVVFGPAADGGYYLIGVAGDQPGLFDQVRWSDPETLADHLKRCRELGLSAALLPMRNDIDTWEDWVRYCARTGQTP
jgi:hypothetical protein